MPRNLGTCPECGQTVGKRAGTSAYKHALHCLHIANEGPERARETHGDRQTEHSRRVMDLLALDDEKE